MEELVQNFDNSNTWSKANNPQWNREGRGEQGRGERDEDKECKADECAFRRVMTSNITLSPHLIAKADCCKDF